MIQSMDFEQRKNFIMKKAIHTHSDSDVRNLCHAPSFKISYLRTIYLFPYIWSWYLLIDDDFFSSSMHCFEGPEWIHLKRGRESFARGPVVKVDPQGRCGGVLVYDLQMIILKAAQVYFASCTFDYFIVYFLYV